MENEDPFRVGVLVGSGVGDLNACEQAKAKIDAGNPSRVNPFTVPVMIANMAAGNVAIALGAKGKCTSVVRRVRQERTALAMPSAQFSTTTRTSAWQAARRAQLRRSAWQAFRH